MSAARRARRFRAFCVGIPKTGTTSIGTIFEHYRSGKVGGSALEQLGCDVRDGRASGSQVREFVRRRDAEQWLEMDSCSANWMVLDTLNTEFPDARFVLTIRDCYSWCDSMINVVIAREIGNDFLESPGLFKRLIGCDLDWFRDEATVLAHGAIVLETLLAFWANQSRNALKSPAERTLVVRTQELSASLAAMADFVGVPRETLIPERSHSRVTTTKYDVLKKLDRGLVERAFAGHADSDFMQRYYPASTLAGFLDARPGPRAKSTPDAAPAALLPESYPVGYWLSRAEVAATRGDTSAATADLAVLAAETLEPDEAHRVAEVRRILARSPDDVATGAVDSSPPPRELLEAVAVIRAYAARGAAERYGYTLERYDVKTDERAPYGLLEFASGPRVFVLEVALRDPARRHWLSSPRFALSYRRPTTTVNHTEQQLAQRLLDAIERHVRPTATDRGPK